MGWGSGYLGGGGAGIVSPSNANSFYQPDGTLLKWSDVMLGSEILTEEDFATHANWYVTGDFDDSGGNLSYTHSTGVGTASQLLANFATTPNPRGYFILTYTETQDGGLVGASFQLTTSFAKVATSLAFATTSKYFVGAVSISAFTLSISSASGTSTQIFDDFSLKELLEQSYTVQSNTVEVTITNNANFEGTAYTGIVRISYVQFGTHDGDGDNATAYGRYFRLLSGSSIIIPVQPGGTIYWRGEDQTNCLLSVIEKRIA